METECGEWKQNNKWWKFELKVSGEFLKNEIFVVDEIENWDVKKFGNENVIDGWDGVFKNK